MSNDAADWQTLKSAWQSAHPLEQFAMSTLHGSLRWRIWLSRAWFALEVLAFLFLAVMVVLNFAAGRIPQAVGLGALVAFCLAASIWARRSRLVGTMDSVPGMVDLTLSRARKSLRIVYASYAVFAATPVWLLFVEGQRPFIEDPVQQGRIILLAICTGITVVYHLYIRARIARFESIRRTFEQRSAP